jgi:hypothetical protein
MKAEERAKNLYNLLGWKGGTIHDACAEIGVEVQDFLYGSAQFDEHGPCADFVRGHGQSDDIALYLHAERGNLQYWFGAISKVPSENPHD